MNENEAPIFYKNPIKVTVPESVVPGTVLVSDIAHDPDNAKLRWGAWSQKGNIDPWVTTWRRTYNSNILQILCFFVQVWNHSGSWWLACYWSFNRTNHGQKNLQNPVPLCQEQHILCHCEGHRSGWATRTWKWSKQNKTTDRLLCQKMISVALLV